MTMPHIWRGMRVADGRPEVGRGKNLLGVCVGPGPADDICEHDGWVHPENGGMSVAPSPDALPPHRIPSRLKGKYPGRFPDARGSNQLCCWSMGEGTFVAGLLTEHLTFRPDPTSPERHGFVEPGQKMPLADYEAALAATRDLWCRWEE